MFFVGIAVSEVAPVAFGGAVYFIVFVFKVVVVAFEIVVVDE